MATFNVKPRVAGNDMISTEKTMPLIIVPCQNYNYEEGRIIIYLRNNITEMSFRNFLLQKWCYMVLSSTSSYPGSSCLRTNEDSFSSTPESTVSLRDFREMPETVRRSGDKMTRHNL